jgi:hypothetical protein
MIQVQIAATVERSGVSGLRWVLVDAGETQRGAHVPAAAPDPRGAQAFSVPDAGAPVRRATLGVHLACAAVLLFALTSAWWVSSTMHGSPSSTRSASAGIPSAR